jgi:diguanylate cyclase (GGDEF)-like protein
MKARYTTILFSLVVTLVMLAAMLYASHHILLNHFARLERQNVEEDVHRTVNLINAELQNLNRTAQDYARWDDTYQFMRNRNRTYLESNYSIVSLENLKVRTIMLLDVERRPVFQRSLHYHSEHRESDDDISRLLQGCEKFDSSLATVSGIVVLSDGPVFVSMRPLLTTRGEGPSRGVLLMVRELDDRFRADLAAAVELPITLKVLEREEALPSRLSGKGIEAGSGIDVVATDTKHILGTTLLNDIWGRPRLKLEIQHDRDMWYQAKQAEGLLIASILTLGILYGGLNLFMVQRFFVGRIERLTRFTESIRQEQALNARVTLEGNDEIAQLARQINRMLEQLENSHEKLVVARERLRYEATHDSLTGSWGRGAALELLDREIARSERDGNTVAVLMLDLDHFKSVNDQFGHIVGDSVLQATTASIQCILRTSDILARYGGEEFLVIAPSCEIEQARRLADRILLRLQSVSVEIEEQKVQVTASIGITTGSFPFSSEELIALADRAMYRAKENGRNRAEWEDALPARVKGALYSMPRRNV